MAKMTRVAIAAAIMAVFLCLPAAAQQQVCGPYDAMTKRLETQYDERLLGRGIDAVGRMLEIWGSPSDMVSCVMLIGQKGTQWQPVEPKPDGPKS